MRLLHLLEATTAGVRRYVTTLLQHPPEGWEVSVACPAIRETHFGDIAFADDVKQLGVPLHMLPLRRSIGPADATAARELFALLRRERFDVIHTHSSKAGFIGRLVARTAGLPAIHTPNGLYFLEQTGFKRWLYLTLERWAGRATTRMIAVSGGEREVIVRHRLTRPNRVRLIENGVDAEQVRREAELPEAGALCRSLGVDGEGPLIGGVGRMAPQKDPLTFVRAAQSVRQVFPAARFVWCGDGELRPAVEELARELNVPLRVTGHLENVWAVMRRFDVFVLPSLYEGLPFTLLEAMALGVPVVATEVVGTRDVMKDELIGCLRPALRGWLVGSRDATALAHAIVEVLTRPDEAHRRIDAAKRLVETRFSIERMVAAHHVLYADVLRSEGKL